MKYCADTWFLLELYKKSERAVSIFRNIIEGKDTIVIPTVSLMELIRVSIFQGERIGKIESLIRELKATQKVHVAVLDEEIAKEAAKVSVSYDVPSIDSIVAATSSLTNSDILLANDEHLAKLQKKKYLRITNW